MADVETRPGPERDKVRESGEYEAPRLERLGKWKALTLQQSIPISGLSFPLGRLTKGPG